MASVTIVDSDRIWFKATHGLDGVTQIGRDPGLCASAIQHNEPYAVTDAEIDPRTADNPLVHGEMGIRFYAAAPITTVDGHRLGTVNVLDTRSREISDDEIATLQDLASTVMDQLELRLAALTTLRHERELREQAVRDKNTIEEFASTLQRTLLPPTLPRVPGLELACHYHAASPREVSGDFYDVFPLSDGRWAFFLGDVQGHGAAAAAVTSLTRYTLRAAAFHHPEPSAVLEHLNSALLLDPHTPQFCTVLFGVIDACGDGEFDVLIGGGGHPPALHLSSGTVSPVDLIGGTLVGAIPGASFRTERLRLRRGETLLLHTDGLTEARTPTGFFGDDGLQAFLADQKCTTAPEVVGAVRELIAGFRPQPSDDIALLALSVPSGSGESEQ
jgi:sigma-B regulation protein RsbU (phosphoserine phosphatase)